MDSFIRLYALYRSITRWQIVMQIYRHANFRLKLCLWGGKIAFALCAIFQFLLQPPWLYFVSMLLSACIWGWAVDRARRVAHIEQYRLYPDRLGYFRLGYQYIRYLQFREKLQSSYVGNVGDALLFLNEQIETEPRTSIMAHPVISFFLGAALAVLGAAAGQWSMEYIAGTFWVLLLCLYFVYMILDAQRTRQSDLKEFKRFLLWARDEQVEA